MGKLINLKEAKQAHILERMTANKIRQTEAARRIGVTMLQVHRLDKRYRAFGLAGLISKKRGRISNNRIQPDAGDGAGRRALRRFPARRWRPRPRWAICACCTGARSVLVALYSDKHNIFRINSKEADPEAETQFSRAAWELGIESIHAHSPQAKGRVKRANQTLQDRLVKEIHLAGINDMDSADTCPPPVSD